MSVWEAMGYLAGSISSVGAGALCASVPGRRQADNFCVFVQVSMVGRPRATFFVAVLVVFTLKGRS